MPCVEIFPRRGTAAPGEPIELNVTIGAKTRLADRLNLTISHQATTVASFAASFDPRPGGQELTVEWQPPMDSPRGYGVDAELLSTTGRVLGRASTAFEVLPDWTASPRYGFLTDFSPIRSDLGTDLDCLLRFHINGLQFYDWQYRHDDLVSSETEYLDPLGRGLSLETVRSAIVAAHERGMAAMAYLAVYAASAEFCRAHPTWALFDSKGLPIPFGDGFLGLMDPTAGGPWADHLLAQCALVLREIPFDGLHVDQYGEPKSAFNATGLPVDLPASFVAFVQALKQAHPNAVVTFNAVGNWPIEELAGSPQDFIYIEVLSTTPTYRELRAIVAGARARSPGKAVVIALYLPADRSANVKLADALILACGGTRIELGEGGRLLTDPYFPKHQAVPPALNMALRRYADFAVRYGEWLGPPSLDAPEAEVRPEADIWSISRRAPGWFAISLINMPEEPDARWDEAQPPPAQRWELPVSVRLPLHIRSVWWASPDRRSLGLKPLTFETRAGWTQFTLPAMKYWALVALEIGGRT